MWIIIYKKKVNFVGTKKLFWVFTWVRDLTQIIIRQTSFPRNLVEGLKTVIYQNTYLQQLLKLPV